MHSSMKLFPNQGRGAAREEQGDSDCVLAEIGSLGSTACTDQRQHRTFYWFQKLLLNAPASIMSTKSTAANMAKVSISPNNKQMEFYH